MHPFFASSACQITPCDRCDNPKHGTEVLRLTEVTTEIYQQYCERLQTAGFTLYTKKAVVGNCFATYTTPLFTAHLAYYSAIAEMRVIHGPRGYLPPLTPSPTDQMATPTFTQMMLIEGGQSNVVQLSDGSFLIVDGGKKNDTDRDNLLAFLMAHKPPQHKRPHIAAWLISHAHNDHVHLCQEFLLDYGDRVELALFGYNFPDFESSIIHSETEVSQRIWQSRMKKILDEHFPTTKRWVMHSGERLPLPGCKVEVLMTWEDFWPQLMKTVNQTSFCIRLHFDSGKTVMLPTDAWTGLEEQMVTVYGDYLKSDVLQATHHGLAGGSIPFYEKVSPAVVFWPSPENRFAALEPIPIPGREKPMAIVRQFEPSRWLLENVKRHYHHGETVTIDVNDLNVIP